MRDLEFEDPQWIGTSPGELDESALGEFRQLIDKISMMGNPKKTLEHFSRWFSKTTDKGYRNSSTEDWASSDLDGFMSRASTNAPLFIATFCNACDSLHASTSGKSLLDMDRINRILVERNTGFRIDGNRIISTSVREPIPAPEPLPPELSQVEAEMKQSLEGSEKLLAEGKGRQAISELLWVLESVSTTFKGTNYQGSTIKGEYFSRIIPAMKNHGSVHQKKFNQWMMALYGHLSSPTEGGIRHGTDVVDGQDLDLHEARLFCDLIRSYINHLIAEYNRLPRSPFMRESRMPVPALNNRVKAHRIRISTPSFPDPDISRLDSVRTPVGSTLPTGPPKVDSTRS